MEPINYAKIFVLTLLFLIAVDMIWISVLMKDFYKEKLSPIARMSGKNLSVNVPAAVLTWVVMVIGLIVLVLPQINLKGSGIEGAIYGAVFGFVTYAVYNLTNFATLKDWQLTMIMVDTSWGTFVCGLTGFVMAQIAKWLS